MTTVIHIQQSRAGKIQLDNTGIVHEDELREGMVPLPNDIDDDKSEETRGRTKYYAAQAGKSM